MWRALVLTLIAISGCCSFRTTTVDRTESDCLVVNPECPMRGIPVSLRVPTHLELSVIETTYWEKQNIPGKKPTLVPLSTCRPTRSVTHVIKETEKIFLVDPVRPAAGFSSYGFTFQSNSDDANKATESAGKGYLQNVQYKIEDKTIEKSAEFFSNAVGLITAFQTAANQGAPNSSNLITTERAVAYARYDVNSPSFEADVASFLDRYINNASRDCGPCPQVCEPERCPR
ncbi:MAG: hypothetical protein NTU79_00330 [Planctomycetota bacterium]|nr:hypothetical protein [Planctomycetota bacterium]